jgi:hypothetical protein
MTLQPMPFRGFLQDYEPPPRGFSVYARTRDVSLETPVLFLERDVYSDELPEAASAVGFQPAFTDELLGGVVSNARQQRPGVLVEELMEALNYYLEFDAFIRRT